MAAERSAVGWRGEARTRRVETRRGSVDRPRGSAREPRRPPFAALLGFAIVVLLVATAAVGPLVVGEQPDRQNLVGRLAPPVGFGGEASHPLGTDGLGRDTLARIVAGARVSLLIGLVATAVAGAIGVALGLVAGAAGGLADRLVSWLVDLQLAIPFVVVAIGVTATLGQGLGTVLVTLALTGWVGYARVVRLHARSLRTAPWMDAARVAGTGRGRLLARHLLPNLAGPVVVIASQQVAAMILYEAALSYLGLGVGDESVTWGRMVADGREALLTAWWVSAIPGLAIAVTVLGLNLVGDWLTLRGGRR